jgi:hypothetical protein
MAESDTTAYAKVVARAWSDPAFKAQLLADPNAALASAGASVPPGMAVKVVESTEKLTYFVLPARPENVALSQESLEKVAAAESFASNTLPTDKSGGTKVSNPSQP